MTNPLPKGRSLNGICYHDETWAQISLADVTHIPSAKQPTAVTLTVDSDVVDTTIKSGVYAFEVAGIYKSKGLYHQGRFILPAGTTPKEALSRLMTGLSTLDDAAGPIGRWAIDHRDQLKRGPDGQEG